MFFCFEVHLDLGFRLQNVPRCEAWCDMRLKNMESSMLECYWIWVETLWVESQVAAGRKILYAWGDRLVLPQFAPRITRPGLSTEMAFAELEEGIKTIKLRVLAEFQNETSENPIRDATNCLLHEWGNLYARFFGGGEGWGAIGGFFAEIIERDMREEYENMGAEDPPDDMTVMNAVVHGWRNWIQYKSKKASWEVLGYEVPELEVGYFVED